ncbi:cytochrome P450 [Coniophora puteana RWD-64-598 SS2]|uniref:Cytochrome P450 n=1 Tax=Coniophora puteana (strain RWD-64-598) TaxID=741705 RepID=A0A5M3MGA6_CONPW|nr:cytochrome P450 [Coniophora puteana RWD-64-598 SS2]EIW78252.1 cytochrome P450 [Coniophora puteana RWD-64-598 SS2]
MVQSQVIRIALTAVTSVFVYYALKFLRFQCRKLTSPLRHIPGPKATHWIMGNPEVLSKDTQSIQRKWIAKFGSTFTLFGALNTRHLFTTDTRALSYVLQHGENYQKPKSRREGIVHGQGLLRVRGEQHKNQRRIMNPAFGPLQLRELTPIIFDKVNLMRDLWFREVPAGGKPVTLNALSWLSKAALDIIGLAGFHYRFNSLNPEGKPNELNAAFSAVFAASLGSFGSVNTFVRGMFPILDAVFPDNRRLKVMEARKTMAHVGNQLLAESKSQFSSENDKGGEKVKARDLLSLLVKANMSQDGGRHLTDDELSGQIPTFLVAGHETTSTATTWALFSLTQHPAVQSKLRDECLTLSTDTPTMDELNALPYLEAVVREALRVHAPVPLTYRSVTKDDVIPLGTPFVDVNGVRHESIKVARGDTVAIPIMSTNHSATIWGEDAEAFDPERWLEGNTPEGAHGIPGVWGNQMTFMGGPHACIGFRFSLLEMKALLFSLLRSFTFELAVPSEDIVPKQTMVRRPTVASQPEKGAQLPVVVRRYEA